MSAPSQTAVSCRMRQSIQKRENKSDCVYPHQAKPFLLSPLGRAAITTIRRSCRAAGMCRPCGWGGGRFWRACRRGFCTERRFPAGGSSWECFRLQDKQSTKQIELCLLSAPSRTAASRRVRQSIESEKTSRAACRSCKAGLRLLSGVYDGYDIPPYEGRGGIFSAKRFVNRAFQTEGEGGVRLPFAAGNAEAKRAVECVHVRRNSRTL